MVWFARPNCQHLDNYRACRVHMRPWWLRWLGRPPCILDVERAYPPRDRDPFCPDQKPWPRPAAPTSGSGVMTHSGGKPHTNVGDRGQRYEVRASGYPKRDETTVIGWAETLDGAKQMAAAIRQAHGCSATEVWDRETGVLMSLERKV